MIKLFIYYETSLAFKIVTKKMRQDGCKKKLYQKGENDSNKPVVGIVRYIT